MKKMLLVFIAGLSLNAQAAESVKFMCNSAVKGLLKIDTSSSSGYVYITKKVSGRIVKIENTPVKSFKVGDPCVLDVVYFSDNGGKSGSVNSFLTQFGVPPNPGVQVYDNSQVCTSDMKSNLSGVSDEVVTSTGFLSKIRKQTKLGLSQEHDGSVNVDVAISVDSKNYHVICNGNLN